MGREFWTAAAFFAALFIGVVMSQPAAGASEESTSWRAGAIVPYRAACETEDAMLAVASTSSMDLFNKYIREDQCYLLVYQIRAALVEYIDGPFPFEFRGKKTQGSVWKVMDVPPNPPDEAYIFLDNYNGPYPVIIDPPKQLQSY